MKPENAIEVKDVTKKFKVYLDKGARYGYAAQKENGKERQALR